MTDREAMKLALEALEINLPIAYAKNGRGERFPCFSDDPLREIKTREAITALRQALEQEPWDTTDMAHRAGGLRMEQDEIVPSDYSGVTGDYSGVTGDYMEQEPVAWRQSNGIIEPVYGVTIPIGPPLYTAPPKREWVGLTDEEIQKVAYDMGTIGDLSHDEFDVCRAVIAKLKEKNHD